MTRPSRLIFALQIAKTELEKEGFTNSELYNTVSRTIYDLELSENLPYNWRDIMEDDTVEFN